MNIRVVGLALMALMLTLLLFQAGNEESAPASARVLPDLESQLDLITGYDLQIPADDHGISLQRIDGQWRIASADGYPADEDLVSRFLINLSELEIAEMKTARVENHERLGLEDNGIALSLYPLEQTVVFGVAGPNGGRFARFAGEDQTFLTAQPLEIGTEMLDWIDAVVLNIPAEQVQSVTIKHQDGSELVGARNAESGQWLVDGLPDDRELRYPTIVDTLGRLLVNIRATGVAVYDPSLFESANVLTAALGESASVEVRTVSTGSGYWLHTNYEGRVAWQYRISEFTYNELTKTMDDLLKEKPEGDA